MRGIGRRSAPIQVVVHYPTTEEGKLIAEYNTSINTVVTENIQKFILGQRPISEWDKFQEELAALPINDLLAVYEGVYARVK